MTTKRGRKNKRMTIFKKGRQVTFSGSHKTGIYWGESDKKGISLVKVSGGSIMEVPKKNISNTI